MEQVYMTSAVLRGSGGHAAGRMLLRQLYREVVGGELPPIQVTDRGKPFFPDSPWHFSVSHTKRHVFCALSRTPIGIDAEEQDREIRLGLAEKILSPGEKARFDEAGDKRLALLTFWVLKEAAVKCTGQGLRGYPRHTDFSLDDPRVTLWEGCLVAVIQEAGTAPANIHYL